MLDRLSSLARIVSSDKRRELMGEVADLFIDDSENFSDTELFLFSGIITKLLDDVDIPSQVKLSTALAPIPQTPHDLVLELAGREAEVAAPILKQSEVLTTSDLIEIATTKSLDHRLAISHRFSISSQVTDALIAHGEQPVLRSVGGNQGAALSSEGFQVLAEKAENDATLCESLSQRSDLPVDVVKKVLNLMPDDAQEKLTHLLMNESDTDLEKILDEAGEQANKAVEQGKWETIQTNVLLENIRKGERELEPALLVLAKQDRPLDVGALLAGMAKIPEKQAVNAIMKKKSQALIVLCRALEIDEKAFAEITEMRAKRLKLTPTAKDKLNRDYADFEVSTAQRIMRFVNVRNLSSNAA